MQVDATVRYDKLYEIGVGQGMNSKVFLAHDAQFSGNIAVKEIPKQTFGNSVTEYYREAERMFAAAHANVVPVFYAGEAADHICIAMPYFPKGSLESRIEKGPLPLREALRVAQGVLSGLAKVHTAGLLHFDVKPSNVLFDEFGNPLLADFGQARRVGSSGLVVVPEMYWKAMPPETLTAGTGSVLSDIYQAGLLLYRAANGDPHYKRQEALLSLTTVQKKIISGKFPDRHVFQPHVPQRLRTAIRIALRLNPADRYISTTEFADQLARIPVPLDWAMTELSDSTVEWRAARADKADLLVRLSPDSTKSAWSVQVYTLKGGKLRAKNCKEHWKSGLLYAQADAHLNEVFSQLHA